MIATSPADILRFVLARHDRGEDAVLVTLTGIERGSSRGIGAQMAVAADGDYVGSFSGGCVEAAVVSEALDALAGGDARFVRFGLDSRYIDIRLPCGGGIDLLFDPRPDVVAIRNVLASLAERRPASLRVSGPGIEGWQGTPFEVSYVPPLRIVTLGQGEDLVAFARLAHAYGACVTAFTPDEAARDQLSREGVGVHPLVSRGALPDLETDAWTAIVFLFHDHDWEEALLPHLLGMPAFYYGAVGSARTHEARLERLRQSGLAADRIALLRGPIGLIPATRDPAPLALSILSEIVRDYPAAGR